jgi:hypothetical protein
MIGLSGNCGTTRYVQYDIVSVWRLGVSLAPHRGAKGLTLGNGLAEGAVFNDRMQVGEMTLGSGESVWQVVNEYTRMVVVNNGNV